MATRPRQPGRPRRRAHDQPALKGRRPASFTAQRPSAASLRAALTTKSTPPGRAVEPPGAAAAQWSAPAAPRVTDQFAAARRHARIDTMRGFCGESTVGCHNNVGPPATRRQVRRYARITELSQHSPNRCLSKSRSRRSATAAVSGVRSCVAGARHRRLPGRVVGSPQRAIARLSDFSNPIRGPSPHHGDNNQSSTVEVCDGRRRAH